LDEKFNVCSDCAAERHAEEGTQAPLREENGAGQRTGSPSATAGLPSNLVQLIGRDISVEELIEAATEDERPRRLSVDQSFTILGQLLQALKVVHEAGLVHRDIKPANILFDRKGDVQLCDFGIAKQLEDPSKSLSGIGMGSRDYMSPEQRQSAKHVDARSDVYSFGVLAYRMLTGELPIGRHKEPNEHVPEIGSSMSDLILACLEQKPNDRPANGSTVLSLFEAALPDRAGWDEPQIGSPPEEAAPTGQEEPKSLADVGKTLTGDDGLTETSPETATEDDSDKGYSEADAGKIIRKAPESPWERVENLKPSLDNASSSSQMKKIIRYSVLVVFAILLGVGVVGYFYINTLRGLFEAVEQSYREARLFSEFSDCSGCPVMIPVIPGRFMMGDLQGAGGSDEKPIHEVIIQYDFAVSKFEVTQREWVEIMGANPSRFRGDFLPVESVSWHEAKEFVKRLGKKTGKPYRLLSEAEWEYVARARSSTKYFWGNGEDNKMANYVNNEGKTKMTGSYPRNRFGANDMHGNVWEWVEDCWHDNYVGAPTNGSAWIKDGDCRLRVLRGGSWGYEPSKMRSANRLGNSTDNRNSNFGFRVARNRPYF
jgi:formylglycine-generating enzyme required for sulfatase activity